MPSARSYFNITLYRKHLTRFWPIWGLYTFIWCFALPLNFILQDSNGYFGTNIGAEIIFNQIVLRSLPEFGLGMAMALGLLAAMAVWSCLYNNRSVSLIHALPIRREGLFFTGFLAGLTFFLLPHVLIFLFTVAAGAMVGAVNLGTLAFWFVAQSLLCLFFFCFATLCAFLTGHILALPAFYAIFNFLTVGLLSLVDYVLQNFVFGFAGITGAWPAMERLSPAYHLVKALKVSYERENNVITDVVFNGMPTIAIYAAAGLLLAALALLFYRHRSLERAGEVVAMSSLRPVFKYGFSFCGALAFGALLYTMFGNSWEGNAFRMLAFLLPCGLICYFAAEMMLEKSFRVFRKSWKGCAVFLLLMVAATVALEYDLTGYERHIPKASNVESITLSDIDSLPYDTGRRAVINASDGALMERLLSLHTCTVANKKQIEKELQDFDYSSQYISEDGISYENARRITYHLSYKMKNGKEIARSYTISVTNKALADSSSAPALLLDILNNRENIAADYFPENVRADNFIDGTIYLYKDTDLIRVQLSAAEAGIIYEAAMRDLAEGGLGRRYLIGDREYYSQVYENRIELTFYGIFPGWTYGPEPRPVTVDFSPRSDSVHLITALQELGILDEGRLVTQLELAKNEMAEKYMYKY